jgi:hypothetical protein
MRSSNAVRSGQYDRERANTADCAVVRNGEIASVKIDRLTSSLPGMHPSLSVPKATDQHFCWSEAALWAWLDLNQRPHPYQVSRAKRCADRRFPRSPLSVRGEGMRS